ncbi:hypothetical protein [Zavarzinella formosa]|uniref:hypothetical protein n=1 Tax=Zavarzinella formosa TaxID=360055 RepID=UPI00030F9E1C|nr:hypothetical protein [Zavarzinella formosa]
MLSRLRQGSATGLEAALLLLAVFIGGALRLAWPGDIEYKMDEAWTFDMVRTARETGKIPPLGMPSSRKVLNPGMSVWVFVALDRVCPAATPVDLVRGVQVCNAIALLLLAGFVWWCIPAGQREVWIWAVFLAAVNPVDVRFQRKIWPPSLFPIPLVIMWIGWWYRDRRAGAFIWGLIGALIGQVHMPGFIMSAGIVGWMLWKDRASVRWRWWLAGSAVGVLPMLNWLSYMTSAKEKTPADTFVWDNLLSMKFYTHWITQPLGIGFKHALGDGVMDFLGQPFWDGKPTYLLFALQGVMVAAGLTILLLCVQRWRRREPVESTPTRTLTNAVVWGYGLLLTISFLPFFRHYLMVCFPIMAIWLAYHAVGYGSESSRRIGRICLAALVAGQLILTASFMEYVHRLEGGGHRTADYRDTYDSPRNIHRLEQRLPTTQQVRDAAGKAN